MTGLLECSLTFTTVGTLALYVAEGRLVDAQLRILGAVARLTGDG
jgi:hypothetical protein